MSMRGFRSAAFRGLAHATSRARSVLRERAGRRRVRPTNLEPEGASDGFQLVAEAAGVAGAGAELHAEARPSGGSDLQAAGRRGRALEGDSDPGGSEEEGAGRGPLEH